MRPLYISIIPALTASFCVAHDLPELIISKRDRHNGGATNHFKRGVGAEIVRRQEAGTVGTNTFNALSWSPGGDYYTNITVGTPPQEQVVVVDTGSSELYFDASSAPVCQTQGCKGGTFDPSKSSSYQEVAAAPAFRASFVDGTMAVGPYAIDVIGIGNKQVSPVQFGVANEVKSRTKSEAGVMGIGYSNNEFAEKLYPNLPEVLKNSGAINSRLYSVYLNDAESSGTILFGGIDRSKFTGDMATVDFIPVPALGGGQLSPVVDSFATTVTGATATVDGKTSTLWSGGVEGIDSYQHDSVVPVLLDTGTASWYLPRPAYREVLRAFPYINLNGYTDCQNAQSGDSLTLEFAGKITVRVDVRSFIVPLINSTTLEHVTFDGGAPACIFLIQEGQPTGLGLYILGDAILRSMYVVFDLDNGQASIAQAAINSTAASDIVVVEAGPNGVAKALGAGTASVEPNSYSIAPQVSATVSYVASSVTTFTGDAAISGSAQETSGTPEEGDGPGSSKGGASSVVVPRADYAGLWMLATWSLCMAMGIGITV